MHLQPNVNMLPSIWRFLQRLYWYFCRLLWYQAFFIIDLWPITAVWDCTPIPRLLTSSGGAWPFHPCLWFRGMPYTTSWPERGHWNRYTNSLSCARWFLKYWAQALNFGWTLSFLTCINFQIISALWHILQILLEK